MARPYARMASAFATQDIAGTQILVSICSLAAAAHRCQTAAAMHHVSVTKEDSRRHLALEDAAFAALACTSAKMGNATRAIGQTSNIATRTLAVDVRSSVAPLRVALHVALARVGRPALVISVSARMATVRRREGLVADSAVLASTRLAALAAFLGAAAPATPSVYTVSAFAKALVHPMVDALLGIWILLRTRPCMTTSIPPRI